jgi:hypothetical protein
MKYISHTHKNFIIIKGFPDVITNPEEYFGPNYKILLNLWIYWDSLDYNKHEEYWNLAAKVYDFGYSEKLMNRISCYVDTKLTSSQLDMFSNFELEIIAAHLLVEAGEPLVYLPLLMTL